MLPGWPAREPVEGAAHGRLAGIAKGKTMALDKPKAPTVDTDPKQATEAELQELAKKSAKGK